MASVSEVKKTSDSKLPKASFAQVVFHNVEESYHVGVDVECPYTVTSSLEVNSRDWVGLFKVGWRSSNEYIYYNWSPFPDNYVKGVDVENKVIFPAQKLPKDDSEFYQFCYVGSSGQIHGASTPFQFKTMSADDLIEIEDENGELLVIRTKTADLEEQLKKASDVKMQMKQEIQLLNGELDLLRCKETELQRKVTRIKADSQNRLTVAYESIKELKQQIQQMERTITTMQEKISTLNQEKLCMEKRLDDNDGYIQSLQEKIKALVNEKDALNGRIKNLEDDKELLYATNEGVVRECDILKAQVEDKEVDCSRLKMSVARMEDEMKEQSSALENQMMLCDQHKDDVESLKESLQNAEDKLTAAEQCKEMLNEDVINLKQDVDELSKELKMMNKEVVLDRKTHYSREMEWINEIKLLEARSLTLEGDLKNSFKENERLMVVVEELEKKIEEMSVQQKVEEDSSMYALKVAQDVLKDRYTKMSKSNDEMQVALQKSHAQLREFEQTAEDQKKEIASLTQRLLMGQESYREKYVDCEKLEGELYKLRMAQIRKLSESSPSPVKCGEELKGSPSQLNKDMQTSYCGEAVEMLTMAEMQQQMADVNLELERRYNKVRKYKRLFAEERKKNTILMAELKEAHSKAYGDLEPRGPPNYQYVCQKTSDNSEDCVDAPSPRKYNMGASPSFDEPDSDEFNEGLLPPMRPLPAPMLPEKLHVSISASSSERRVLPPCFTPVDGKIQIYPEDVDSNGLEITFKPTDVAGGEQPRTVSIKVPQRDLENYMTATDAPVVRIVVPDEKEKEAKSSLTIVLNGQQYVITDGQVSAGAEGGVNADGQVPVGAEGGEQREALEDEKFVDAVDDVLKFCPVCSTQFPSCMPEREVNRHVDSHFTGAVCPMCDKLFPGPLPNEDFQNHVNSHFNER